MAEERTVVIDGYAFHSRKEAQKAQKELEGIRFVQTRMEGQDPAKILEFYHKMLDEEVFETVVGLSYEREIYEELTHTRGIDPYEVRPVNVKTNIAEPAVTKQPVSIDANNQNEKKKKSGPLFASLLLNLVLLLLVLGMFYLANTSGNVNILNYENELVNKYENWQMELEEREAAVLEKEKSLGISE